MPDQSTHNSSTHTSSHTVEPRSEHIPLGVPVAASAAFPALRIVVADDNPVVRAGLAALLNGRDDIAVVAEARDGRQALALTEQHRPDVVLLDVRMPGVDGISALPYLLRVAPVMMLTYSRENAIVQEALRLGARGYLVHGEFTAEQLVAAVRDVQEGRAHLTATAQGALLEQVRGRASGSGGGGSLPEGLGRAYEMPARSETGVPRAGADAAAQHAPRANPGPDVSDSPYGQVATSHVQSSVGQSLPGHSAPQGSRNRQEFGLSSREVEVMDLIASGMSNQQIAATCFISEKTVKNHINRIFAKLHSASRSEAIAVWLGTARGRGPESHG
ncbi:response regulator transcription factor [Streptomyces sp. E11-3]|uniref:response regulator n=1 Tax=Streptomyces sp. E11-3 TaxID=3110112 RepID=UPI00397F9517